VAVSFVTIKNSPERALTVEAKTLETIGVLRGLRTASRAASKADKPLLRSQGRITSPCPSNIKSSVSASALRFRFGVKRGGKDSDDMVVGL
jgi:hypothetical protein